LHVYIESECRYSKQPDGNQSNDATTDKSTHFFIPELKAPKLTGLILFSLDRPYSRADHNLVLLRRDWRLCDAISTGECNT